MNSLFRLLLFFRGILLYFVCALYSAVYVLYGIGGLTIIPGTATSNTKHGIVCKLNGACSRHRAAMVQGGSNRGNTNGVQ